MFCDTCMDQKWVQVNSEELFERLNDHTNYWRWKLKKDDDDDQFNSHDLQFRKKVLAYWKKKESNGVGKMFCPNCGDEEFYDTNH